ncbi:MAG: hypothetical protein P4M11_10245 [Candidatus Pacebacteria bacterium]|nr:hypothetical protein [Candidatus Paceibacterota bacterium]
MLAYIRLLDPIDSSKKKPAWFSVDPPEEILITNALSGDLLPRTLPQYFDWVMVSASRLRLFAVLLIIAVNHSDHLFTCFFCSVSVHVDQPEDQ